MIKKWLVRGQNYVLEFVLLSFIGIVMIAGIYVLHNIAIDPIYDTNAEIQTRIIRDKIHLSEHLFRKYRVDEGALIIEIPKKINYDIYYITSRRDKEMIIKTEDKVFVENLSDFIKCDVEIKGVIDSSNGKILIRYFPSPNQKIILEKSR